MKYIQKLWILEFPGYSSGENKKRKKRKRKEELIMKKIERKLSKKDLKPNGEVNKAKSGRGWPLKSRTLLSKNS